MSSLLSEDVYSGRGMGHYAVFAGWGLLDVGCQVCRVRMSTVGVVWVIMLFLLVGGCWMWGVKSVE